MLDIQTSKHPGVTFEIPFTGLWFWLPPGYHIVVGPELLRWCWKTWSTGQGFR